MQWHRDVVVKHVIINDTHDKEQQHHHGVRSAQNNTQYIYPLKYTANTVDVAYTGTIFHWYIADKYSHTAAVYVY